MTDWLVWKNLSGVRRRKFSLAMLTAAVILCHYQTLGTGSPAAGMIYCRSHHSSNGKSPEMMSLMSSSGGAAKMNIQPIMNMLLELDSRREAAIRCLVVYLREKEELFKEHLVGKSHTVLFVTLILKYDYM